MSTDNIHPDDRPWRLWGTSIVGLILAFAVFSGFVLMPVIQGYQAGIDAYTAICRALGIAAGSPGARQPQSDVQASPVSLVAWTPQLFSTFSAERAARGRETAASVCMSCHGETGISADAEQFPNMAGQSSFAIYKQLYDYKSGVRKSEVMQPIVADLTEDQMADVSAFYARQQPARWDRTWGQTASPKIEVLVRQGDSARGLPACESCHNPTSGGPIETPVLFAQTKAYLAAQMRAYRSGERRNDLYGRMRNIALKLSDEEIDGLAQFYFERR
jgi:cytochrome c553